MYDLDDNFLAEIGIINMPEEARDQLVTGIQKTIQDRVLIKLADQITDFLESEIEQISGSLEYAKDWLKKNFPYYADSNEFAQFSDKVRSGDNDVVQLFAQNKWFEVNLPTFPAVVEQTKEEVKQELKTINGK
jgi:hypothetical protein